MAIYKRGRGFELGATEKQIQLVVRAELEPGTVGLRVRHADPSSTLPPRLEVDLLSLNVSFNPQLHTYAYLFGETANVCCSGPACARKCNKIVSKI